MATEVLSMTSPPSRLIRNISSTPPHPHPHPPLSTSSSSPAAFATASPTAPGNRKGFDGQRKGSSGGGKYYRMEDEGRAGRSRLQKPFEPSPPYATPLGSPSTPSHDRPPSRSRSRPSSRAGLNATDQTERQEQGGRSGGRRSSLSKVLQDVGKYLSGDAVGASSGSIVGGGGGGKGKGKAPRRHDAEDQRDEGEGEGEGEGEEGEMLTLRSSWGIKPRTGARLPGHAHPYQPQQHGRKGPQMLVNPSSPAASPHLHLSAGVGASSPRPHPIATGGGAEEGPAAAATRPPTPLVPAYMDAEPLSPPPRTSSQTGGTKPALALHLAPTSPISWPGTMAPPRSHSAPPPQAYPSTSPDPTTNEQQREAVVTMGPPLPIPFDPIAAPERRPSPQPGSRGPTQHPFERSMYAMAEASQSAPSLASPVLSAADPVPPVPSTSAAVATSSQPFPANPTPPSSGSAVAASEPSPPSGSSPRLHARSMSSGAAEEVRRAQAKESTRLERRWQALLEIYDTERAYLRDLGVLAYVFLDAVEKAPFASGDERRVARRNVDQVLQLGERMERRMHIAGGPKLEGWRGSGTRRDEDEVDKVIERVAKAFVSESPIFAVYEEFCSRHTEAANVLRALECHPEWDGFFTQSALSPSAASSTEDGAPESTSKVSPAAGEARAVAAESRLGVHHFAMAPIQRIMRYPMLLGNLAKYMGGERAAQEARPREKVVAAIMAMKQVAENVDEAKKVREGELRTEMIAGRMELHPSYRAAFVSLLGQIQLVGSLHVLYHGPQLDLSEGTKIKYHGVFLYQTHLVIVKVKRATVYEPRHWFPIRYFEVIDVVDGTGIMPHSFVIRYRHHHFEFGATCETEKGHWIARLRATIDGINQMRAAQIEADVTLTDDSIVSSIALDDSAPASGQVSGNQSGANTPILGQIPLTEEPGATSPGDEEGTSPTTPVSTTYPPLPSNGSTPRVSQRLSRNVNTLLGRTPAVTQAAIDLKLTDVFSDQLLACRAAAIQEQTVADAQSHSRVRTMSSGASKRPALATATWSGRSADKRMKRMSYMEPPTNALVSSDEELDVTTPPLPLRAEGFQEFGTQPSAADRAPDSPSKPPTAARLRRMKVSPTSKSNVDIPTMKEWRAETPKPAEVALPPQPSPNEARHRGDDDTVSVAGVERHGSSGSSSSASSGGPTTPQPAFSGVSNVVIANGRGPVAVIPEMEVPGSQSMADSFLNVFTRRPKNGPVQHRSAPGSAVDLPDLANTDEGLERRSNSSSWLPGLKLVRRMSRASSKRSDSTSSSGAPTPPMPSSVPVPPLPAVQPLMAPVTVQTSSNSTVRPTPMSSSTSAPMPSTSATVTRPATVPRPATPQRSYSQPGPTPPAAIEADRPGLPRKKSLKAFLRMTPMTF